MTPEKCSATVSRLGEVRRRLQAIAPDSAANIVGMTYDPAFDDADRLHDYGVARGLSFDNRTRLVRVLDDFDTFRAHLDLGVGYGPVTVNRHRVEALILDPELNVIDRHARTGWDAGAAADRLAGLPSLSKPRCPSSAPAKVPSASRC